MSRLLDYPNDYVPVLTRHSSATGDAPTLERVDVMDGSRGDLRRGDPPPPSARLTGGAQGRRSRVGRGRRGPGGPPAAERGAPSACARSVGRPAGPSES